MRIITWNCGGGKFRAKAQQVARLKPDVLAVQEVENLDKVKLVPEPAFQDRAHCSAYPRRSMGIFSYTGTTLEAVDQPDDENLWTYAFRRFEVKRASLPFHVAAVWTYSTKIKENSYRQAHKGLGTYDKWMRHLPTVLLGDFNTNAKFQVKKSSGWPALKSLIDSLGLVSAYHESTGEEFGKESQPTHFPKRKNASPSHIDYCFLPKDWTKHITKVEVGDPKFWTTISDHVPLIVDLDL